MGNNRTLNTLLNSLCLTNVIKNWTILEEKSGDILVKVRFTNSQNSNASHMNSQYRKKSTKQIARDRERAVRHRELRVGMKTRAIAATEAEPPEQLRDSDSCLSEPPPLDISPACVTVSSVESVVTCEVQLNSEIDSISDKSFDSTATYTVSETSEINDITKIDSDLEDMPPVPLLPPLANINDRLHKFRCSQPNCFFGGTHKRYELQDGKIVLVPLDTPDPVVFKCFACPGPTVFVCRNCCSRGRHKGHQPWLKLIHLNE